MSANFDRAKKAVNDRFDDLTIEQYSFGFVASYVTIVKRREDKPFSVYRFDNIETLKWHGSYDSRTDAAVALQKEWLKQF